MSGTRKQKRKQAARRHGNGKFMPTFKISKSWPPPIYIPRLHAKKEKPLNLGHIGGIPVDL